MDDARELTLLRERITFQERLDELLEAAVVRRSSLADTLSDVLPLVSQALRAERVWLETLDEELVPRVFGVAPSDASGATQALGRGRSVRLSGDGRTLLVRRLDVAGVSYGIIGAELGGSLGHADLAARETLLGVAAEELDDHLADIRNARQKQRLLRAVHDALRHPLVHEGVRLAVERMSEQVLFDLMIVLYHLQEDYTNTLHYLVFRGRELEFRTGAQVAGELDRLLRQGNMTRPGGAPFLVRDAEVEHSEAVRRAGA